MKNELEQLPDIRNLLAMGHTVADPEWWEGWELFVMKNVRVCKKCHEVFETSVYNQIFCEEQCRIAFWTT